MAQDSIQEMLDLYAANWKLIQAVRDLAEIAYLHRPLHTDLILRRLGYVSREGEINIALEIDGRKL